MVQIENHPQRAALTEELHARPFQPVMAPCRALLLAFKQPKAAAERDHDIDRSHLLALLDQFDAPHPAEDAKQHTAMLDDVRLKWESHTEFVSYTLILEEAEPPLFQGRLAEILHQSWLDAAPGNVIAAAEVELITAEAGPAGALTPELLAAFEPESLAASLILDQNVIAIGDFRIDERGFTRFALVVTGQTGPRRLGRAMQRLLEIEIYRTMAMLALPIARRTAQRLNEIERGLAELMKHAKEPASEEVSDEDLLAELSTLSAEIEALAAANAFRMDAAEAYARIVVDRISLLKEAPILGRQQFGEFMTRRFQPAIRTIQAAKARQTALSDRAARLAELLRTRVNVALEAQNQQVLERMDSRAAVQLRLQQTVEGLSVVAISYYAVGLLGYLFAPASYLPGLSKTWVMAIVTLPVVLGVWWLVRRVRTRLDTKSTDPKR
ncbi:MAG: DUF3422 domain-containing protein [Pseudomonadota bacterium]